MLIAKSMTIVGVTNIHAIARSESPFIRRTAPGGVASAARSMADFGMLNSLYTSLIWQNWVKPGLLVYLASPILGEDL